MKKYSSTGNAAFARSLAPMFRGATAGFQGRGVPTGGTFTRERSGALGTDLFRTTVV
ncbi:hypothetical protein [Cellulomonas citrea]|uniref:hypothetical protein n=1 Tax=Cellulomonas citrea TaxID=1909423 RepID=UPI0013587011|nr:hypothetical protein [Cellulomonas citrea]